MQDPIAQFSDTFDGRFYFTNASKEDFTAKWAGVEYTFPAEKTSPIVIPTATLEETQSIRKKFAKEYAEREFYKSSNLKKMETKPGQGESFHSQLTYTDSDLESFIQSCLKPLPVDTVKVTKNPGRPARMRLDEEGKPVTKVLRSQGDSLVGDGTVIA